MRTFPGNLVTNHLPYSLRLLAVRTHFDLTKREFSQKLGLSLIWYEKYESGRHPVPLLVLHNLYRVFYVNLYWFFTGEGDMLKPDNSQLLSDYSFLLSVDDMLRSFEELTKCLEVTSGLLKKYKR